MKSDSKGFSNAALIVLMIGWLGATPLHAQEVGAVAGEFSVTPDGQAAYTIPIQVPPGVNGVQPGMAIGYHSGGDNGPLGLGGQLSGFSAIARCAANLSEDGVAVGVLHSPSDRFCLDGQKLVAVSGTYGANGTEYRTRIESYQRVVSHGAHPYTGSGTGPLSFSVQMRSGGTLEFGLTDNARIRHPQSGVVHEWRVSRLTDVNGNRIDYTYQDFGGVGASEVYPVRVDYGANAGAGQGHHLAVTLGYEARPDTASGYQSGIRYTRTRRLAAIGTEVDGAPVKHYPLTYDTAAVGGFSRLVAVTECAGDGVTCYAPTTFDWQAPVAGWSSGEPVPPDDLVDDQGRLRGLTADLNGDGLVDWLTAYRDATGTHLDAWLSTGAGFSYSAAYAPPEVLFDYTVGPEGAALSELADVNGDGLPDWVTAYRDATGTLVRATTLNNGSGFSVAAPYGLPVELTDLTAGANGIARARLADLDGDALPDVIVSTRDPGGSTEQGAWINTGSGWSPAPGYLPPVLALDYVGNAEGTLLADLVDLNGDGLGDWVQAVETGAGTTLNGVWLNVDGAWSARASYHLPAPLRSYLPDSRGVSRAELLDINGDGLVDVVQAHRRADGTSHQAAWLNTGDDWVSAPGLAPPVALFERNAGGRRMAFGSFMDLDGDGRADIARSYRDESDALVSSAWLQTSSGWAQDPASALPMALFALRPGADSIAIGGLVDMNNDAAPDLVRAAAGRTRATRLNGVGTGGVATAQAVDAITTGFGLETHVEYALSTRSPVYEAGGSGYDAYPNVLSAGPMLLVGAVEASDGVGGLLRTRHAYGGARVNATGLGSLGFAWREIVDVSSDTAMLMTYSQAFPNVGQLLSSTKHVAGVLIAETTQTPASLVLNAGATHYPYVAAKSATTRDLDGSLVSSVSSTATLDSFANITHATTETSDATGLYGETVTNTWQNDTTNWVLGKLIESATTSTAPGVPAITRTVQNTFNAQGQVTQRVVEPGHAQAVTTSYAYDAFGNTTSTTAAATGLPSRTGTLGYSADGRFPVTAGNPLGHVLTREWDARFGKETRLEDPNGAVTTRVYDDLGRQIQEKRLHVNDAGLPEDGTDVALFHWCGVGTNCPDNALYFVGAVDNEGESPETLYYDGKSREVRKQTHGFDGSPIYADTEYNARGKKARVSRPYFSGAIPEWTTFTYDALDRVVRVVRPNGAAIDTAYSGRSRTLTNALGQTSTSVLNAVGKPVEETDAAGSVTRHRYDAAGNLIETEDPLGNRIAASFDVFGRKTAMFDPDMGAWSYQYDAFGRLVGQTDAKGQTVTMAYDLLGRMVQRVEPEGTTTWTYDTAPHGLGKLAQVTQTGYTRAHTYDDRGRPAIETVTIDGKVFKTTYAYEGTTDRLDYVVYPNQWTIQKSYNDFGYPLDVRSVKATDAAAVNSQLTRYQDLHQAAIDLEASLAADRQGHYDQMVYHNGLADPLAAEAKLLANSANKKVEQYNDAASQSRKYAQRANDHSRRVKKLNQEIDWRKVVIQRHKDAMDAAAAQGSLFGVEQHANLIKKYIAEADSLSAEGEISAHKAEGNSYAANDWAARANAFAAEAESLNAQAQQKIDQANGHYAIANTHVDAINAIDRRVEEAVEAANVAYERLQDLQLYAAEGSVTHWAAQGAAADGQVTQFVQGNGIETTLEYYGDTGRLARIRALGDPGLGLPLTAEEVAEYLARLQTLVADFNAQVLDFGLLASTAASEKALAESEAANQRAIAEGYRDLGEIALGILADARALQLDVEVAIQDTRILLNEGLVGIHTGTVNSALALISRYEGAAGVPGQGQALQVAFHELLEGHYRAVENLYQGLSATYASLESQAAALEASPPVDQAGFLSLAAQSTDLATYNEVRAAAFDQAVITRLEGGAVSTPLAQQSLSLSASLLEQRGFLFDHHGDVVDALYRRGRDLGALVGAYYAEKGAPASAGFFEGRATLGQTRVDFLRRMGAVYKNRGAALLAELQAEQAAAAQNPGGAGVENQFAELAGLYTTQAATYTGMSTATYWQDFYFSLGNRLLDATTHYTGQAGGNANLADRHAAEAALARNAADHRLLVGVDGAVQDEQYFYDAIGNLTGRTDHAIDLAETFDYDALNRLTGSRLAGRGAELYQFAGVDVTTYDYDALGNLVYRSDVGSYSYGSGIGTGAGTHAVSAITGLVTTAFAYDANGNQESGNGRTLTWTSYNKPSQVSAGGSTVAMGYGPERQLVKQATPDGAGTRTTYYPSPLFEKTVSGSGAATARYHVTVAGKTVAVINETTGDAPETHYLHRDHLDSVVAVSNERGLVIERFHFDPFGKRRMGVVTDDPLGTTIDLARTDRGFTGHRHLAGTDIIHMNGRVYDPGIGRFLSADPHIQFPGFSQSYNRYSYLMNNPLNAVDPSGYFLSKLFKKLKRLFKKIASVIKKVVAKTIAFVKDNWKTIAAVAIAVAMPQMIMTTFNVTAVTAAAITGGVTGLITTGSLEGALIGAATGAALAGVGKAFAHTNGIAGRMGLTKSSYTAFGDPSVVLSGVGRVAKTLAHGLVGGASGKLSGASFSKSFLSTGFTQAVSPGIDRIGGATLGGSGARIVAAGIVGGTAAEIAGGQFKHGFRSGAMSRAFNDEDGLWKRRYVDQKPQGDFVETKSPITGENIWVHRDYVDEVATYSPPSNITNQDIADSADYVSTGFGAVATYGFYTGQMYMVLPAASISFLAQGVRWFAMPPSPATTFAWYADQLLTSSNYANPVLQLGLEVLNPFQSTLKLIGE